MKNYGKNRVVDLINDQLGDDEQHAGDGKLDYIPLSQFKLEPQLRKLGITIDDVIAHSQQLRNLEKELKGEQLEQFIRIQSLAESIKEQGLIQPVTAYEDGEHYALIAGERRLLAHFLCKKKEIRALIKPKPSTFVLATLQMVENLQRQDISLKETVQGLIQINDQHKEIHGTDLKLVQVSTITGSKKTMAGHYLSLIKAPKDVLDAVNSSRINNVTIAAEILKIKDPAKRELLIQELEKGANRDQVAALVKEQKSKKPKKKNLMTALSLGKTTSPGVMKMIVENCLPANEYKDAFDGIDWSNIKNAKKAWAAFIKIMEGRADQ